jgi:hypothetical protein
MLILLLCAGGIFGFLTGCRKQIGVTPLSTKTLTLPPSNLHQFYTTTPSPTLQAPSPINTAPPIITATPSSTNTLPPSITATPDISQMTFNTSVFESPNGEWAVTVRSALPLNKDGELYADYAYDQVTISQTQGEKEWTIIDQWSANGLGSGGYEPFLWAENGEYVYITYEPTVDGCGLFVNGSNLLKVNLNTGETVEIVSHIGLWLSLSPDETLLAYMGYGERGLVIRELATGNEQQVGITAGEDHTAGYIIWSQDGEAVILTLGFWPCSENWVVSTSIIRIETATLEQRILINEDERLFVTLEWPTPDKVLLKDGSGNLWWMDPETGKVTAKK